ncbi:hypothetical protein I3760_11G042500 [Carya illinoinensis]|uniref:Glutathione S-transferase n=1 Tax=Carya illinoinensis TaxID=32201 RepID=A0A922DLU4_CARIL|nr:hypothetical protein I3760_11G042500 [Carya illinoinensis]KAG6686878.1 hypothetical protein I3842_11G043200 [Carya illinoinensis]
MAEENKVILHGFWPSPFVKRVELALKIKGIPYDYVEEDLPNKSSLLLEYNPVYKKVPVLVHNGKPIAESIVILEYIDETWKNGPSLLPEDPYKRAEVRFWASFLQQQLLQMAILVVKSDGEAQEKAIEELFEKLKLLEERIMNIFPEGTASINQENMGLLDIVLISCFGYYKVLEEVLGFKVMDPEKTPLVFSWLTTLLEIPVVKEAIPSHEKEVLFIKYVRQNALNPTAV